MILKPCPFCRKEIPRAMTACPYCHRDEKGQPVTMDSTAADAGVEKLSEADLRELASEDPFVRYQAVGRVAQRGFGVVLALMSHLSDFKKPGLAGMAEVLGKIGDRRAIPALAQAAKMGDEDLRMAAVAALAQFSDREVLPILIAESERAHPLIQSYLANVLGAFQDSQVVPVLAKLSTHSNREVAFQAVCALGETGDRAAIPVLQRVWRRRDALVRRACSASLRRLGAKPSWVSPAAIVLGLAILAVLGIAVGWMVYK